MALSRIVLLVICLFTLGAGREEPLQLLLGEEKELTWKEAIRLNVSRRGVVEVEGGEQGTWRIAAVGTGSVVLTAYSGLGAVLGRRVVRVQGEASSDGSRRVFVCEERDGVTCDATRRNYAGETTDLAWWWTKRRDCAVRSACTFDVTLGETARKRWQRQLRRKLAPWFHVRVDEGGRILALASCEDKAEAAWQDLAERLTGESDRDLTVRCRAGLSPDEFVARARVIFVRRDQAEALGMKWDQPLERVTPKVFSSLLNMRESVVGEPVVRFMSGEKASVHTGGENLYRDREGGEHWQALGLKLDLSVPHWSHAGARLDIAMTMRQPESRDQVKAAGLTSRVSLVYGEPTLVGRLDLAAKTEGGEALAFFSGIPIIGPLAKFSATSEVESRLYLVMTLDRAVNVNLTIPADPE